MGFIAGLNGLAIEQVAARRVTQRQRIDATVITGSKPAFEIDAPDVIGRFTIRKRATMRRPITASPLK